MHRNDDKVIFSGFNSSSVYVNVFADLRSNSLQLCAKSCQTCFVGFLVCMFGVVLFRFLFCMCVFFVGLKKIYILFAI